MRREKLFQILAEQRLLAGVIDQLPVATARELRIQNEKLYRMALKGIPLERRMAKVSSVNKRQKLRANYDKGLLKQLKTVRRHAARAFKSHKRLGDPDLTNREFQHWKRDFDQTMSTQVERLLNSGRALMGKVLAKKPPAKSLLT